MRQFCVVGFEQFQHYRDRAPPWIKLHSAVLDDYRFACLQDASKAHLMLIWLLASRSSNVLPWAPAWLSGRIGATEPIDLDALHKAGFIEEIQALQTVEQPASTSLAKCSSESEGEREGETEGESPLTPQGGRGNLQEAVDCWNLMAGERDLPQVQRLTDRRRRSLSARLRECGGLAGWQAACAKVGGSHFLTGGGREGWRADFDFMLQESSFTKLMEGKYDGKPNGSHRDGWAALGASLVRSRDGRDDVR